MAGRPIDQIPHWCWFTAMFLYQADKARSESPDESIDTVYSSFLEDQHLASAGFQLRNQGLTMMLAYGLLVVPRELWRRNNLPPFPFRTKSQFTFLVDTLDAQHNPGVFIRCMRNAIAHCNVEIKAPALADESDGFTLWNESDQQKRVNFKVQVSWKGLSEFIDEVAKYYVNTINPLTSGDQ